MGVMAWKPALFLGWKTVKVFFFHRLLSIVIDGFQIEHRINSFELVNNPTSDDLVLAEVTTDETGVIGITDKRVFRASSKKVLNFTGFVFDHSGSSLPEGFIWASGKTIGDVGSGATERENADCFDLFCLYWKEDHANYPMLDKDGFGKTRGSSALADWMAKCKIYVPDLRDRVIVGKGDMGGSSAGRVTVSGWLAYTWQNGSGPHNHGGATHSMNRNVTHKHDISVNDTGSGEGHSSVQPSYVLSKVIKL